MQIETLEVTQKFIDNGKCRDGGGCPVALCIQKAGYLYGEVAATHISLNLTDYALRNDEALQNWILDFDNGKDVKPFSLELDTRNKQAKLRQ